MGPLKNRCFKNMAHVAIIIVKPFRKLIRNVDLLCNGKEKQLISLGTPSILVGNSPVPK